MVEPKNLNNILLDESFRFDFFQAVRLLERLYPESAPVGLPFSDRPEVVQFRSNISLAFPASEIQQIKRNEESSDDQQKFEMFVNFMGMLGVSGILPIHYTELAMDRARYGDKTLWAFLDIFTHRSVSLFYRAWEKYRFPVQYERGNDDFTNSLFAIAGLGTPGMRGRLNLDDESLLPYAGLIAQKPRSAVAISQIVSDYFQVPAKVVQFTGQWLELDEESHTYLGRSNNCLGANTIVGTRIWDFGCKFRLKLGPMSFTNFLAFLPIGSGFKSLCSIVELLIGKEFDADVQLRLKAKEVPGCVLTTRAKRRPMLGWTSFLKTRQFEADDEQLILQVTGS